MLGTVVNAVAIIVGGVVGILLHKGIPDSYKETIMQGLGLCVGVIGLMGALKTQNLLMVIFSIVIGIVIGEALRIEERLNSFGVQMEKGVTALRQLYFKVLEKLGRDTSKAVEQGEGRITKGFVTASLIFCVGAMAIVGSLESGLAGNHETLFAKSLIDGVTSIIFASSLGVGVVFSSVAVFIYQGFITLTAAYIKPFLVEGVIVEMSAIGGLLILGISMNILEIKRIKVGNMLPAVFLPIVFFMLSPYLAIIFDFINPYLTIIFDFIKGLI